MRIEAPDIAWIILPLVINAYWMVYDFVLAPLFNWTSMTDRFRYYLHESVIGPILFGFMMMVIGTWLYHLFQQFGRDGMPR